jgi:hypothetical protein
MKILLVFLFTLLFNAPQKQANFVVVDDKTKEEIIGAKVTVDTSVYYTDFDGIVHIELPAKNEYDVTVEYPSYKTKKMEDIDLESMIIPLKSE